MSFPPTQYQTNLLQALRGMLNNIKSNACHGHDFILTNQSIENLQSLEFIYLLN